METKPPLSSSNIGDAENGKSEKDKKTTSIRKYGTTFVPFDALSVDVNDNPETKSLTGILAGDASKENKGKNTPADDNKTVIPESKDQPKQAKQTELQERAATEERSVPEIPELPSADEILAQLNQVQEAQTNNPNAEQAEEPPQQTHVTAELSMEEGEADLPLDAADLHRRLQTGTQKLEAEPPKQSPQTPEQATAESTEQVSPEPEIAAGQSGGGEQEPPQPPRGSEQEPGGPEPEQPRQSNTQETTPVHTARPPQTPESITRQLGQEVTPSVIPPIERGVETPTIVHRADHTGLLAALVVGVVDWRGRRKIKKELRRGQARQDKRLRETERALQHTQAEQMQQQAKHRSITEHLRGSIEDLSAKLRRPEATFSLPPQYNRPPATIEQQDTLPLAGMAAAAERHDQRPERHQLQTSAWHSYEVDRKTGHVVEHPSFVYGREFKREQSREKWQKATPASAAGQLAMIGSGATSVQQNQNAASPDHSSPSLYETTVREAQITVPIVDNVQQSWLWAGLVIVVFIIASTLILN